MSKLAEALFDAGDLEESRRLFEALTEPAGEPAAQFGLGRIAAARGPSRRGGRALPARDRAVSRSSAPRTTRSRCPIARSDAATRRSARSSSTRRYGARWPALRDPVLGAVTSLRDDAGAKLQRGREARRRRRFAGAIAAHEAALARDPSFAQAHANLISLYGRARNWRRPRSTTAPSSRSASNSADAHYDYGVLLGLQEKWDDAADAYRQAIAVNPLHARGAQQPRTDPRAPAQVRGGAGRIPPGRREPADASGSRASISDACCIALGRPDEAIAELAEADRAARRRSAALSVRALRPRTCGPATGTTAIKWATDARQLALEYGQTRARRGDRARPGVDLK